VRKKLWLISLVLSLAFAGITAPRVIRLDSPDFKVFYTAAKHALYEPENLYKVSPDRYLYPPTTALLLAPFGFSDSWNFHRWSWHVFTAMILFFLAKKSWAIFFAILCLNRYFSINFGYGQINPLLLLLVFSTSRGLQQNKFYSAALWPVASILKVYPLVQGLEFLLRKNWKNLALSAVAFFVLLLLPFMVWPRDLAVQLHFEFFQSLASKGLPTDSGNQSIYACFIRFFHAAPFQLHPIGDVQWNILSLSSKHLAMTSLALGSLLTAITWFCAHKRKYALDFPSAVGFSLLFLSHIVWKDYFVFLLFPLAQVILYQHKHWKIQLGIYLALVYGSSPEILTHYWSARLEAINIHFVSALFLWTIWIRIPKMANDPKPIFDNLSDR